MKRSILILLASLTALLVSCNGRSDYDDYEDMKFNAAKASYYGDYYNNGCANYILKLVCGRYDSEQNLVGSGYVLALDLNLPSSNRLELSEGVYVPLRSGMSPEYTFVRGTTSGTGDLDGSYLLRFYGDEENGEAHEVTDGKVKVSYSGNRIYVDALLVIDGHRYRMSYSGDILIYDETFTVPANPVLNRLNSAEATNYGRYYDGVAGDMWFIRLFDTDYETTGESVEIEVIAPSGLSSLPVGEYQIEYNRIALGDAVYGWVDEDNYVHGTWYCYDGAARYGATSGVVTISSGFFSNRYTIDFECYDAEEKNYFRGSYNGVVSYISPSELAQTKSGGRACKGDVLVSTALTVKGKHAGSRRLAR